MPTTRYEIFIEARGNIIRALRSVFFHGKKGESIMRLAKWKWLAAICAASIIAGCGGGSDGDDNKPADPAPPPEDSKVIGTGELNANTYVVSESATAGSTLTADTFTVTKPQATVHKTGDVLVIDAHGGRLVRIVGVQETATEIRYQYEQASLAEAFKKLDVHLQGTLTAKDLGDLKHLQADPELTLAWAPDQKSKAAGKIEASETLQLNIGNLGGQLGRGSSIDGHINFQLNPDVYLKVENMQVELSATISPNLDASVTYGAQSGAQISYTLGKDFELPPFKTCIVTPVWPCVPFWVTPVVNVSGGISGTASSSFETTLNYGISGELGFTRFPNTGFQSVANYTTSKSMEMSETRELGVTLAVPKLEVAFMIYSVSGPFVDLGLETSLTGKEGERSGIGSLSAERKVICANEPLGQPGDVYGSCLRGVDVTGSMDLVSNAGVKAKIEIGGFWLWDGLSFDYSGSIKLFSINLYSNTWFFPYPDGAGFSPGTITDPTGVTPSGPSGNYSPPSFD